MKPSQILIDKLKPVFGLNTDLVVECFVSTMNRPATTKAASQALIDVMFSSFVSGIISAMSPNSKFSKEFKTDGGQDAH